MNMTFQLDRVTNQKKQLQNQKKEDIVIVVTRKIMFKTTWNMSQTKSKAYI